MKRGRTGATGMTRSWRAALFLILLTGGVALVACHGDATSRNAPAASAGVSSKIDPALSVKLHAPDSAQQDVDVLIRTRGAVDATRRVALESHGARISSISGDVATARIPVSALSGVAALDFVVRIELSRAQRLR